MGFDIRRLEYDRTGVATANKVVDDLIELPSVTINRAIRLKYGLFYVKSLVLKKEDGTPLIKWKDYRPVVPSSKLYRDLRKQSGKDVGAWIMIDTTYEGRVIAEYQAVGMFGKISNEDLIDIMTALGNDRRGYYWENINDLPSAFPPAPHKHNVADLYNWYSCTQALLRYASALEQLDTLPSLDEFAPAINALRATVNANYDAVYTLLKNHYQQFNNPHKDAAASIPSVNQLKNYSMATLAEAIAGIGQRYMSPLTAAGAADTVLKANDNNVVHVGRVPMLQFGDLTTTAIPYTANGMSLSINADVPVIMASRQFTVAKTTLNLADWVTSPANRTLFLYVRVRNGAASYEVASAASPETTTFMNVGSITTNATAISNVVINKVSGVGTTRVSPVRIGSAIAVTQGLPSRAGTYAWKP